MQVGCRGASNCCHEVLNPARLSSLLFLPWWLTQSKGHNFLPFIFCWRQLCPSSRDGVELQFLTITADNAVLAPGERKLYLRAATKTVIRLLRAQVMVLGNHNTFSTCISAWLSGFYCYTAIVWW